MLILSADHVRKALPTNEAIEAMKTAYAALERDGFCAAADTPPYPGS